MVARILLAPQDLARRGSIEAPDSEGEGSMFLAVIKPEDQTSGSAMELSGEVVPYDLQLLRDHLLQLARRRGALQVRLRAAEETQPRIRAELGDLDRRGVSVVFHAN
jgi:hypothetical protein